MARKGLAPFGSNAFTGALAERREPCGVLTEQDRRCSFQYSVQWLADPAAVPVSLTLPLRAAPYVSDGLHPFFENLRQEDFCQLAELSPKEKYDASAERCVKLLRQFASEPLVEILKLYRLLVFAWWSGNGDLHLKNLSLLVDEQGLIRLTPAYDLVSTRLVIANDPLALPIMGRKDKLDRTLWLKFAEYCQLPARIAARVLDAQAAVATEASSLIDRCFLPAEQKVQFQQLIKERSAQLRPTAE